MAAINYLTLRSTLVYTAPGVQAPPGSIFTVGSSGVQTLNTTTVALGASTNQSYNNLSNGSFTTGWGSTLTGLTAITDITMSQTGQYQLAVQNGSSTIRTSANSGITWSSLTGANGLPVGATAYPQATATGTPNYTAISVSATGQYQLASVRGGLLYVCANGTSATPTFTAVGMGAPAYYLPMENAITDVVGTSAPAATGSITYTTGIVGSYAAVVANTAGTTPSNFIRGTIPAMSTLTVSGWINFQTVSTSGVVPNTVFSIGTNAQTFMYLQYINGTGLQFHFLNSSNAAVTVGTQASITTGTWYNFAIIYNQTGTCYFYLNNVLVGSVAGAALLNTMTRYSIGTQCHAAYGAFNGYIDDLRIYNSAVTYSPIVPMNWTQTAVSGTGQYMLAASNSGLFQSSDYGATWAMVVAIGSWTGLAISASGQYMAACSTSGNTYAPYYSTNYGANWTNTTFGGFTSAFIAISGNGQYSLTGYAMSAQLISNYLAGYSTTTYTSPSFPGINGNIIHASLSATGQFMVVVTLGATNNVYYSINYGAIFTALTVGSLAMKSCAMSADGSYLTVSNATTVYTLNRNTQGFTVAIGNQAGVVNQGQHAIAIGNQAGHTNQSANSIVLNASGSAVNSYLPGLYATPIANHGTSISPSFNVLGYGSDSQIVQSAALTILQNGNVGIGTNNPTSKLHIVGDVSTNAFTINSAPFTMSITYPLYLYYISATNNAGLVANGSGDVSIFTGTGGVSNRLTIKASGDSSYTAGDSSYIRFGPNAQWSSYLTIGATGDRSGPNNAQVISTNGNLHLDGGNSNDIYYGYYANYRSTPNNHRFYGGAYIMASIPQNTSPYSHVICMDGDTMRRSQAIMKNIYFSNNVGWSGGVNMTYAFYKYNSTCPVRISGKYSGFCGGNNMLQITLRLYSQSAGTYTYYYLNNFTNNGGNHHTVPLDHIITDLPYTGWYDIYLYNSSGWSTDGNDQLTVNVQLLPVSDF